MKPFACYEGVQPSRASDSWLAAVAHEAVAAQALPWYVQAVAQQFQHAPTQAYSGQLMQTQDHKGQVLAMCKVRGLCADHGFAAADTPEPQCWYEPVLALHGFVEMSHQRRIRMFRLQILKQVGVLCHHLVCGKAI